MKKALIITGILVGIGTLAWYLKHQANLLMQYCLSFVGYRIHTLNRDRITIEIALKIENKSNFDIAIDSYNFNVFLNGAYVTKISSNKIQNINKKGFSIFSLMIDIEPKKNKDLANWDFLSLILLDVNNIKLKVNGTVSVSSLGISAKAMPIALEMKLKDMKQNNKKDASNCK